MSDWSYEKFGKEISIIEGMNKSSVNIACLSDFEQFARVTLDKRSFDYIEGGADDEQTIKSNVDAFKRSDTIYSYFVMPPSQRVNFLPNDDNDNKLICR